MNSLAWQPKDGDTSLRGGLGPQHECFSKQGGRFKIS